MQSYASGRIAQETAETKAATAAQQTVAQLRDQQARQEGAEQRIKALRARVGSGGSGEGSGSGSGTAGTGTAAVLRGPAAAVAHLEVAEVRVLRVLGAQGLAVCRAFVCVPIRQNCRRKLRNAWNIPPQSKDLQQRYCSSLIGPAMWSSPV